MKKPYISPVEKRFGDIAEHILIGRMAQHWTLLHFNIYAMFLGFTDLHREVATAIFFTLKADSAQREITLAAALA